MPLTWPDEDICAMFRDSEFSKMLWQSRVEELAVARLEYLGWVEAMLQEVERQWHLLPYRYGHESRIPNDSRKMRGSGGYSGFHIEGKIHSIQGGVGKCTLTEMEVTPEGRGREGRSIDVRERKMIETDDVGPIRIYRNKVKLTLLEGLRGVVDFLQGIKESEVHLRLIDGPRTVLQLVRDVAEGDEGAEEELFNLGQSAKEQLLEMLASGKSRKHDATISGVLLTCFPSAESREAVEKLLGKEKDAKRKREIAMLLAAAPS